MAKKLPSSINLLEPVNAPDDIWESLYFWVFNVGKYIFVFVELIVLIVFMARFTVDKSNNDLTREINSLVEKLSTDYYKSLERKAVNLHSLLGDIETLSSDQELNSKTISSVLDSIPSYIQMLNFSYRDNNVNIRFTTVDLESFQRFEDLIEKNQAYKNITFSVTRSEGSPVFEGNVSFTVVVDDLVEDVDRGAVEENAVDGEVAGVGDDVKEDEIKVETEEPSIVDEEESPVVLDENNMEE